MGLLGNPWESKDWNKRKRAVDEGKVSKGILITMAKTDPDKEVRKSVLYQLSLVGIDVKTAMEIIKQTEDSKLRQQAIDYFVKDESEFVYIAKTDNNADICRNAVFKIKNQEQLKDIAETAICAGVRNSAVYCIKDEEFLKKTALTSEYDFVRKTAVEQTKFTETVKKSNGGSIGSLLSLAVNALSRNTETKYINQDFFIGIAKNDEDSSTEGVCYAAVKRIDPLNQKVLIEIAKTHKGSSPRWAALCKINDSNQSDIIEIANNDKDESVCATATEKINDNDILLDFFNNHKYLKVRQAACGNLYGHDGEYQGSESYQNNSWTNYKCKRCGHTYQIFD